MAKLALLLVAFALLFLAAKASTHATIEIDKDPLGQCEEQFMRHQGLMQCQMYMREKMSRGGYYDEMDNQREQYRSKCCNQLSQMDEMCVCLALAKMTQEMRGQFRGPQLRQMYRMASRLPSMCNVPPMRQCPFGSRWVF